MTYLTLAIVFSIVVSTLHYEQPIGPRVSLPVSNFITIEYYGSSQGNNVAFHAHHSKKHDVSPDYMSLLPVASRSRFTCVMWVESRSTPTHLNATDYNPTSGAGGVFQFLGYIYKYGASALGIPQTSPQSASLVNQFKVAAFYYKRNGGLKPEWQENC